MELIRKCTKMKLFKGYENEYKKRHSKLWPDMKKAIHDCGGRNYSIFLDKETNYLYGYIEIEDEKKWESIAETEICKKWWAYMKDIMETNKDNSPVSVDLDSMFYLE